MNKRHPQSISRERGSTFSLEILYTQQPNWESSGHLHRTTIHITLTTTTHIDLASISTCPIFHFSHLYQYFHFLFSAREVSLPHLHHILSTHSILHLHRPSFLSCHHRFFSLVQKIRQIWFCFPWMDLVTLASKSSSSYTTLRQTYARWRIFVPVKGSVQIASSITLTSVTWFHGVSRAFLCPLCVPTGVGAGVTLVIGWQLCPRWEHNGFAAKFSPGLESSYLVAAVWKIRVFLLALGYVGLNFSLMLGPTCLYFLGPVCLFLFGPVCLSLLGPVCLLLLRLLCLFCWDLCVSICLGLLYL